MKHLYIHPGTVTDARAWAKLHGVNPRRVISARQAMRNHLHGEVLTAVLIDDSKPPASIELWDALTDLVFNHNVIALATSLARKAPTLAEMRAAGTDWVAESWKANA